ncbi:MAG TPA: hypothetical protein VMO26_26695 [Vicinamibacterales bacterium]|nr:hypothetical protein [Vicinamibacterales bacterium]
MRVAGHCDPDAPPVFGNSSSTTLGFTPSITSIEQNGDAVGAATEANLRASLSAFATAPFQLSPPGTGNQSVSFTFTNNNAIPLGVYDLTVEVKPETGTGVGAATKTFTIQVEEPQLLDTLAPTVNIVSPSGGASIKINDTLLVNFTAVDLPQGGAGTGVTAMRAAITSCEGVYHFGLTSWLLISPSLPVAADVTATAGVSVNTGWLGIGSFVLDAEADDGADHTGYASATFSVGANIAALPPISVPNRQFNSGSTVPVKFSITDATGSYLPPMGGLIVRITAPGGSYEDRVAGSGATDVRWETDEYGNATQYITNYQIPVTGTYYVEVLVGDVCSEPALQGGFTFVSANKGGKQ